MAGELGTRSHQRPLIVMRSLLGVFVATVIMALALGSPESLGRKSPLASSARVEQGVAGDRMKVYKSAVVGPVSLRELVHSVRQGAAVAALAFQGAESNTRSEPSAVSVALVGNFQGFAKPCFCGITAASGGLEGTVSLCREWKRAQASPTIVVDVGGSLLPDKPVPRSLRRLAYRKVDLFARAYREIGLSAFCPTGRDLRPFSTMTELARWCKKAGTTLVITNAEADVHECVSDFLVLRKSAPRILLASCLQLQGGGPTGLRTRSVEYGLSRVGAELKRGSFVLLVVHNPIPASLESLVTTAEADRLLLVAVNVSRKGSERALQKTRVIRPSSRGRSVQFLSLGWREVPSEFLDASFAVLDFESCLRTVAANSQREPRGWVAKTVRGMLLYCRAEAPVTPSIATRVRERPAIADHLAAYERAVLSELSSLTPYAPGHVPPQIRALGPEACAKCHERQTRAFLSSDPHRKTLETLLNQQKRQADFSCLACHAVGMSKATVDNVAGRPRAVIRSRNYMRGLSCRTCHTDVGRMHAARPEESAAVATTARESCRRCHDEVNSPDFSYDRYRQHLGCCKPAKGEKPK